MPSHFDPICIRMLNHKGFFCGYWQTTSQMQFMYYKLQKLKETAIWKVNISSFRPQGGRCRKKYWKKVQIAIMLLYKFSFWNFTKIFDNIAIFCSTLPKKIQRIEIKHGHTTKMYLGRVRGNIGSKCSVRTERSAPKKCSVLFCSDRTF